MDKVVYADLNQGIDSFVRVTMTLRRKEINIQSIRMITDSNNNASIELTINEDVSSIETVLNYMSKLHDVENIEIENRNISTRYA
ncbi:ACT domain-containing protein [Romboutsia sp.]|uniref:ACT domain-containing protein n=1 Tax=Romboutsia sp. TaxID=1965302 RepID=UPI003F378170